MCGRLLKFILRPSLTAQWLPANFTPSQPIHPSLSSHSASHLLLGTHASDNEPNFLLVAHVNAPVSFSSSSSASFKNAVHVMQKIYVNSEVNRARHCPQRPSLVACQTGGADFLLFDLAKHPSKPVRDSVCIPDARLVGHKKQGCFLDCSR
jgi:histone-binding protein RBBP4